MPGLPDYKVEEIRENLSEWFLTDTCEIYMKELVPDGTGSGVNTWVLYPGGGSVPCRFEQMTFRAGQLEQFAGEEYLSIIYKVYLPYNTNIDLDCRVKFKNVWYETRVFNADMTQNLYKLIHVTEVLSVRSTN